MKFGEKIINSLYEPWRFYYMDYNGLKSLLKPNEEGGMSDNDEQNFVEILYKELEKVESFHKIKTGEISRHVEFLRKVVDDMAAGDTTSDESYGDAEAEINQIITEVNELAKFTRLNYSGFLKIVKKHDKITSYHLKPLFSVRINKRDFYKQNYDRLLVQLSALYTIVRNKGKSTGEVWTAGGTRDFVRKTTKYWVHPDNVLELKLYILKHLPVLVYNASSDTDLADPAITSIYFDNESFDLYLGRLEKHEGAEAIRLRWYGPTTNREIFVERKTHHEDWTGEKSVKQRFPIKEKNVNSFLNGTYTVDKMIEKMKQRGNKSQKEIDALETLAGEVQHRVLEKGLRPAIRSFYNRTAFQLPDDACVRISLDTELSLIREDNFDGNIRSGDNWRRTDIGTDFPFNQLKESDICRFPYAILEVKLQTQFGTEPPEWVQHLINSHLVEAVPKFSKYIHGVATLCENKVNLLPFWLPQMEIDIRKEPTSEWIQFQEQMHLNNSENNSTKNGDEDNNDSVPGLKNMVQRINNANDTKLNIKRIQLPTRVEPKIFFANERTFLSWLHFGVILGSLAIGLFNFGDKIAQLAGTVFTLISMGVMLYSVFIFSWRSKRIRQSREGPYDDPVGPLILVLSLFAAIAVNFYLKIQAKRGNLPPYFY